MGAKWALCIARSWGALERAVKGAIRPFEVRADPDLRSSYSNPFLHDMCM